MLNNNNKLQQAIKEIGQHAIKLYELMDSGTTVEVTFSGAEDIMIPGQSPKIKRLIITKPNMHLALQLTPINNN
jgi:hypothetical protein